MSDCFWYWLTRGYPALNGHKTVVVVLVVVVIIIITCSPQALGGLNSLFLLGLLAKNGKYVDVGCKAVLFVVL